MLIAARAHARGVRVIAGTIPPDGAYRGYSAVRERLRRRVNAWIRATHAVDGVVDWDRAMRVPGDAARLNPAYDSGDGLHPNNRGYRAMGDAVPLSLCAPPTLLDAHGDRSTSP